MLKDFMTAKATFSASGTVEEDVLFGRSDPAAAAKRFMAEATAGIS